MGGGVIKGGNKGEKWEEHEENNVKEERVNTRKRELKRNKEV